MRRIPNSNLTVTQFGIGTATFGGDTNKEEAFKMLDIGTKEYGLNLLVSVSFRCDCWSLTVALIGHF